MNTDYQTTDEIPKLCSADVEKFIVFFYRSRDHGRGIMTSYLGSLAHKSLKLTKIMPNSIKLLDNYILSNAPPKKRQ